MYVILTIYKGALGAICGLQRGRLEPFQNFDNEIANNFFVEYRIKKSPLNRNQHVEFFIWYIKLIFLDFWTPFVDFDRGGT